LQKSVAGKSQQEIQKQIQPNEAAAQAELKSAESNSPNQKPIAQSIVIAINEGEKIEWVKKALEKVLRGIEVGGVVLAAVGGIIWWACGGHVSELLKMAAEFGGFGAMAAFVIDGLWSVIEGAITGK